MVWMKQIEARAMREWVSSCEESSELFVHEQGKATVVAAPPFGLIGGDMLHRLLQASHYPTLQMIVRRDTEREP